MLVFQYAISPDGIVCLLQVKYNTDTTCCLFTKASRIKVSSLIMIVGTAFRLKTRLVFFFGLTAL